MIASIQLGESGGLLHLLLPATAFAAGLLTSLHCVGMCGPMSCAILQGKPSQSSFLPAQGLYHAGRLISYAALGALAGLVGSRFAGWFGAEALRVFPWVMAAVFLALGLGLDGWLTRWQARQGWGRRWMQRAYQTRGAARGLALGLATPLIPCGPLYLMLWAMVASGSAVGGALAMLCFAAGTVPALFAAQQGWRWLASRTNPNVLAFWRRGLCVAAGLALIARAMLDTNFAALAEGGLCH